MSREQTSEPCRAVRAGSPSTEESQVSRASSVVEKSPAAPYAKDNSVLAGNIKNRQTTCEYDSAYREKSSLATCQSHSPCRNRSGIFRCSARSPADWLHRDSSPFLPRTELGKDSERSLLVQPVTNPYTFKEIR